MAKPLALVMLRDDVDKLFKLGEDWDFTEREIEECIEDSLSSSENKIAVQTTTRTVIQGVYTFCGIAFILGAFVLSLILVGKMVIDKETTSKIAFKFLHIFRQFVNAVGMVGISKMLYLDDYASCIVNNPLWTDTLQFPCFLCESVDRVVEFGDIDDMSEFELNPLIHKNLLPRVVSLDDVTAVVQRSKVELSTPVKSSASWSRTAREFADNATVDKIKNSHEFYFHWHSLMDLTVGKLIRTLFPKPDVFKEKLDVSLNKIIYVDGPNKKGYQLPISEGGMAMTWYSQGYGVRTLQFSPMNKTCTEQCSTFQITLSQRDALSFANEIWKVAVLDNGDDLSVSYQGFVSFLV